MSSIEVLRKSQQIFNTGNSEAILLISLDSRFTCALDDALLALEKQKSLNGRLLGIEKIAEVEKAVNTQSAINSLRKELI